MGCMLVVKLLTGDEIALPSQQDGTATEIARNLATRLKPDTCLWGEYGAPDEAVAAAVVIPAHQIDHIVVMEIPTAADLTADAAQPGPGEQIPPTDAPPAATDSPAAESFASSDSAAPVPTDETTGPVSTG